MPMHEHQHGGMGDGKARMQKPMEPMTMQLVGAAEIPALARRRKSSGDAIAARPRLITAFVTE
jgi:hypothetical protein